MGLVHLAPPAAIFSLSVPVELNLAVSRSNLVLTWPTNFTGYTLQSTTNLGSLPIWTTNLPAPVVVNFSNVSRELTGWKSLVKLLVAEGQLAELEDGPPDAAQSYVDAIQFGIEISRGGLIIHRMMGIGCEGFGGSALAKLVPKLTCDQARPLVSRLEKIDETSITWEETSRNERNSPMSNWPNITIL
jgi:hypothetical protein